MKSAGGPFWYVLCIYIHVKGHPVGLTYGNMFPFAHRGWLASARQLKSYNMQSTSTCVYHEWPFIVHTRLDQAINKFATSIFRLGEVEVVWSGVFCSMVNKRMRLECNLQISGLQAPKNGCTLSINCPVVVLSLDVVT